MPPTRYLSTPDKEKIVEARKNGNSVEDVRKLFKCSPATVKRLFAKGKTDKTLHRAPKSGRQPITTPMEDRAIIRDYRIDPNLTSSHGIQKLKHISGKDISRWSINRRLIRAGLYARRPAKRPYMTAKHRKKRYAFAKNYEFWTVNDWARVWFTDETKVNLYYPDGHHLIRRPIGQRYKLKYVKSTVKFGGGSIMLWGNC